MCMLSFDSVSWPTGQAGFGRPFCFLQSAEECSFETRKHVAVSCRGRVHRCELGLKQNRSGRCNLGEFEWRRNAIGGGDLCHETASIGLAKELQCLAIVHPDRPEREGQQLLIGRVLSALITTWRIDSGGPRKCDCQRYAVGHVAN